MSYFCSTHKPFIHVFDVPPSAAHQDTYKLSSAQGYETDLLYCCQISLTFTLKIQEPLQDSSKHPADMRAGHYTTEAHQDTVSAGL